MKRFIILIITLLELFLTASCTKNDFVLPTETTKDVMVTTNIGETYTDFEGMNIKITDVILNGSETELKTDLINNTAYKVMFGEYFEIKKEKNGEWISCQVGDVAFNDIAYLMESGTVSRKTYNLINKFDVSESGKYRLFVECSVYDNEYSRKASECKMWADFTVVNNENAENKSKIMYIDFIPQYIRTNGVNDSTEYPMINIITSTDELKYYYECNRENFFLERRYDHASDSTVGFLDVCDKYDDAFFSNSSLVLIVIEEGSGSVRHNVDNVKFDTNGCLSVNIRYSVPDAGTCDMAQWHIILELSDDFVPKNVNDVFVYMDGNLIT